MRRLTLYGAGLVVMLVSVATPGLAAATAAPEIDGSSVSMGLGLLAGGVLILRARLGKSR